MSGVIQALRAAVGPGGRISALSSGVTAAAVPASAGASVLVLLTGWVLAGGFGTLAREHIDVLDARIPRPSTPGLTALYLTLRDTGPEADALIAVSTPDARVAMLMADRDADGSGVMEHVASITVPAHGAVALGPYTLDIVLEDTGTLHVGQDVPLTLTFRTLGTVTADARVVAAGAP